MTIGGFPAAPAEPADQDMLLRRQLSGPVTEGYRPDLADLDLRGVDMVEARRVLAAHDGHLRSAPAA